MQRGRLLVLVGLFLILFVVVFAGAYFFLVNPDFLNPQPPTAVSPTEPPPAEIAQIVIAVQPVKRGDEIKAGAVELRPWPRNARPPTAIESVEEVIGKLARYDIEPGEPVLKTLVAENSRQLSDIGSEVALRIPPGKVAITIPMTRMAAVGYALQEGDHVNILAALLFVDVNETTQTVLPDKASVFTNVTVDPVTGSSTFDLKEVGPEGIVEISEGQIRIPFFLQPSEAQRPRLVVQQIIEDAIVLKVGNFTAEDVVIALPTATLPPEGTPPPPPTPIPPPDIITLIVTPQDAVVINYFMYTNARLTLALRAAGDQSRTPTESVNLESALLRYKITIPTLLNVALEPAMRDLHQPPLPNEAAIITVPLPDGRYICLGANCPPPITP